MEKKIYRAEIDWKLLLGGTATLSAVLHLLFRQGARHGGELMKIRVAIGGKESSFTALHDTGNTLRNPVDGRPVLVMEQAAVMDLLPAADAAILREKPTPEIAMARLYAAGSRLHFTLLPFRSVGTKSGLLLAVRSDYIALHRRRIPRTLIALSVGPLSDGGGYCALWGGTERGGNMKKLLLQLRIWLLRIARPDKIMYIGGSDTLPQPLSRTEEAQLIAQMDQGDFFRSTNAY